MGKNDVDDVERWLMSPDTTIEDLERIANADEESEDTSV